MQKHKENNNELWELVWHNFAWLLKIFQLSQQMEINECEKLAAMITSEDMFI